MKFSAYMFIRNGIKAGYTFMEAIESVLPFADEFFILDGKSDDGTLEALEIFSSQNQKIRIESKLPQYIDSEKDESGILLGAAFEEARQKCNGDWLIQVQADTVFHPITVLAARYFLMQQENENKFDAIRIIRHQYRWNWQDMYRQDYLNLIFKKSSGKVFGDAIDIEVNGRVSKKLLPLFKHFPATDNAWVFFENIIGKMEGCFEIWPSLQNSLQNSDFAWYNNATKRSLKEDLQIYHETGTPPPFWQTKVSPFKDKLPENVKDLIGKVKYEIKPEFKKQGSFYDPDVNDILEMIAEIDSTIYPLRRLLNFK